MQFKQTLVPLLFLFVPFIAFTQTTYLPQDARENHFLDRMEIKAQTDSILNFSKTKPYSRKQVMTALSHMDPALYASPVDRYNYRNVVLNNLEWATGNRDEYASKHPAGKHFYQTPATLYEVNTPDFFLAVNPVVQFMAGKEKDNDNRLFLNSRGVDIRGRIANKIGFAAYLTDNQERDPLYVQQWEIAHKAVPGEGFYQDFRNHGYDYFDARGHISFNAARFIDITFGYDKNFIGNGYRSLFLSDFSSSALFLKFNTRVWKLNYQNLFMELTAANRLPVDQYLPKKYAAMHHLDVGITNWLNVGLFEGIIFSRTNHFEFGYLNPVIFYRSIEQQSGSFDNSVVGIDAKANVAHQFQLYGQFLLDEFNIKENRRQKGWWGNKWAIQAGAKYIDALGIKNLDLQLEFNRARPYTYSHTDSAANYTHYNQPLAHPLGANFQEVIGIARYQSAPKWRIEAKGIYYNQGKDTGMVSLGSNIFLPNRPPYRIQTYGVKQGNGIITKTSYASFLLSYEVKPDLFLETTAVARKETATNAILPSTNTFYMYAGVRWNMHRRIFDF